MRFENTVLQVIPALDAGGAERTTVEIARAIVDAGGRALVATSGGRLSADIVAAGGQVFLMPVDAKNPLTLIANRFRLASLIRREEVDIIHARSRAPAWSALMAARATGIASAATYHGAYRDGSPLKRFYNSGIARADLVIANSAFTAAAVSAAFAVGDRLRLIPRGADLDQFNPEGISPERLAALRARWGLVENAENLVFLLPGRLTDWKGHQIAIEAAARLKDARCTGAPRNFQLIFAGGEQGRGDYAASLARWVDELGLQHVIRMVGHCEDMPAAYALSDVVLAPSTRPEAFGRVAVEAGAMGRAVIAADHGGARETIVDGETGFLVEPGSVDALAAMMVRTADLGVDGRRALGARARARIAAQYSTRAMTDATLDAYRELLSRKAQRRGTPQ